MVLQGVKEKEFQLIFVSYSKSKTIISRKNFAPAKEFICGHLLH